MKTIAELTEATKFTRPDGSVYVTEYAVGGRGGELHLARRSGKSTGHMVCNANSKHRNVNLAEGADTDAVTCDKCLAKLAKLASK